MASTISQIKQQVNQIGQQASTVAGQLFQLANQIDNQVVAVDRAIGGTASGEDKAMVSAFMQANKAVKDAAASLQAASNSAKEWAAKA